MLVCGDIALPKEDINKVLNSIKVINGDKTFYYKDDSTKKISDNVKKDVLTYYEYMQFKRARFECDVNSITYSPETGRILSMSFNFTGDIN